MNYDKELKVWGSFDYIASISEECTTAFLKRFPKLKNKIILIENILSPLLIRQLADCEDVSAEMPNEPDCVKLYRLADFILLKTLNLFPKSVLRWNI